MPELAPLLASALILGLLGGGLVLRVFVVEQDAVGGSVHVVVLAAVHRPEEDRDADADYHHGNRNHYVESGHFNSVAAPAPLAGRRAGQWSLAGRWRPWAAGSGAGR